MTSPPSPQPARVARLIFLLEEFMLPHEDRHPDVRAIVQKRTQFDRRHIYVGRRDPGRSWVVSAVGIVGLAALDPWFHGEGLSESVITKPGEDHETLDVGGVTLLSPSGMSHRVHIDDTPVSDFFGIGKEDWLSIIDPPHLKRKFLSTGHMPPTTVFTMPSPMEILRQALQYGESAPVNKPVTVLSDAETVL